MDIQPNSVLLNGLIPEDVLIYLGLTGWKQEENPSRKWLIFRGHQDIDGNPLETIIPLDRDAKDMKIYLSSVVNLLSAIYNENPETIITRIKFHDYDILNIIDTETGGRNSILLSVASKQINKQKSLIEYAISSEYEPRPYFNTKLSRISGMLNHYEFGQTFSGSFGFRIQSRIRRTPVLYEQLSLFAQEEDKVIIPPFERRVIERIIRGLITTKKAFEQKSIRPLIDGYAGGLNSNMCIALADLAPEINSPVEYSVLWSPRIEPPEDLKNAGNIRLNRKNYEDLRIASKELKAIHPQEVVIEGPVSGLSSKGNPLGDPETSRSVIIKWTHRTDGRPIQVIVPLEKEDYLRAYQAHLDWSTVQVRGVLVKSGDYWRLVDPKDFRITFQ